MTLAIADNLALAEPVTDPFTGSGNWHVLHTRGRQEKILADDLAAMGIRHFLPMRTELRYHGQRKALVDAPIFPGYVFLRGSLDDAYLADRTRRVVGIIRVCKQEQLHWELSNLRMVLSHQTTVEPYPFLKTGVRVEVTGGPLRGLQGIIESRTAGDRLILQVNMLGRAVSVEIDPSLLEVVN